MKLIYIDESGNTGTNLYDPQQRYHLLAALFLNDISVRAVENEIKTLGLKHFGAESLNTDFEFHGYEIHKGKGRYFSKVKLAKRLEIMDDLLDVITKNKIKIACVVIDKIDSKERLNLTLHPHQLAFIFLTEMIEAHLKNENELGLLIADENRDIEQRLIDDLEQFKTALVPTISTDFAPIPAKIEHIVDSIHFVKSHNNPLIQLADITAFTILRTIKTKKEFIEKCEKEGLIKDFNSWVIEAGTLSQKTEAAHFKLIEEHATILEFPKKN